VSSETGSSFIGAQDRNLAPNNSDHQSSWGAAPFFFFSYFLKIFAPRVGGAALLLDPSPFSRRDLQLSPSTNGYTQPTGENNTVGEQQPTTNKIKTTKTNESRCIDNITTGKIGDFELNRRNG
jgi:hypothetical protein